MTRGNVLGGNGVEPSGSKREESDSHMIETFDAILDGLMLGDGCIAKPSRNALYQHSCKYKSYLLYLKEIMEVFGLSFSDNSPYTYTHKKNNAVYSLLISRRSSFLTLEHQRWYKEGKKEVPVDLAISPEVVRHWYCGDGSLGTSTRKVDHIILHTNGFSDKSRYILQVKLQDKGWHSSIMSEGRLYIGPKYFLDFLAYTGESPVPCYQYKWMTKSIKEYKELKKICEGL